MPDDAGSGTACLTARSVHRTQKEPMSSGYWLAGGIEPYSSMKYAPHGEADSAAALPNEGQLAHAGWGWCG